MGSQGNMISIDTNVLVRRLVRDDENQSRTAASLISSQPVFVATTALMESEWVLRKTYRFSRSQIVTALEAFLGLRSVTVDHAPSVKRVLDAFAAGLDFADAVHLAQSRSADQFATFDPDLVRIAALQTGLIGVFTPRFFEGGA